MSDAGSRVVYRWTADAATPVALDSFSSTRRRLQIRGSTLTPGVMHRVHVQACMQHAPTVCGYAATNVTLLGEPLRGSIVGGERTGSISDAFTLDACNAHVPGQPGANISFAWQCVQSVTNTSENASAYLAPCTQAVGDAAPSWATHRA